MSNPESGATPEEIEEAQKFDKMINERRLTPAELAKVERDKTSEELRPETQSRFPDGEIDFWPYVKNDLQRFDSLPDSKFQKQINAIESRRNHYLDTLTAYAKDQGCSFAVTPPKRVALIKGGLDDIWACAIEEDTIQIPRYVFERRPEIGEYAVFRKEVPAIYILANLAHEIGHLERGKMSPDFYRRVFAGHKPDERYKIRMTDEFREEEMSADKHAYILLTNLNIPITPALYVAQVLNDARKPGYREELFRWLEMHPK